MIDASILMAISPPSLIAISRPPPTVMTYQTCLPTLTLTIIRTSMITRTRKSRSSLHQYQSDFELQTRTAHHFSGDQHSSSTNFRCVNPECLDEFSSTMPIHAWYLHLESPKHRKFLDNHGQLACEFRYGRSFLDE